MEEVDGEVEMMEQAQIHTDVCLVRFLPRSIHVSVVGDGRHGRVGISIPEPPGSSGRHIHSGYIREACGERVVAHHTIGSTDLQVVDIRLERLEELLVRERPAGSYSREEAESMPFAEVLGAVVTEGELQEVAHVVVVGGTSGKPLLTVRQQVIFVAAVLHLLRFFHVIDERSAHIVLAELVGIVYLGLQRPDACRRVAAGVGLQIRLSGITNRLGIELVLPILVHRVIVKNTIIERNSPVVEPVETIIVEGSQTAGFQSRCDHAQVLLHIERRCRIDIIALGIAGAQTCQRIGLYTAHTLLRRVAIACIGVAGLGRQDSRERDGIDTHRIIEEVGDALLGTMIIEKLCVHVEPHLRGSRQVGRDVALEEIFAGSQRYIKGGEISRLLDDTILIIDAGIEVIGQKLAAAPHVDVKVLVHGIVFEKHAVPVVVGEDIRVGVRPRFLYFVVAERCRVGCACCLGIIVRSLIEHLHIGHTVCYILHAGRHGDRVVEPDVHLHLLREVAELRIYQDDTVGTSGAVKRGSGCVFQHGERFDRLGGNVVEHRGVDLHAVEQDERSGA